MSATKSRRRRSPIPCQVCGADVWTHGLVTCGRNECRIASRAAANRKRAKPWQVRFWEHVDKTEGCWEWRGASSGGYGSFWRNGRCEKAHRVAYEIVHGDLPAGTVACHRCDNPGCVRPDHIFAGSQADNVADMVAKNRQHRGERTGGAVLTEERVREIRRLAKTHTGHEVARALGINPRTALNVIEGRYWTHI